MTTPKSSECRAKNPAKCRYHGAVLRMEKALAKNNLKAYIKARDEVDALKRDPQNDYALEAAQAVAHEKARQERDRQIEEGRRIAQEQDAKKREQRRNQQHRDREEYLSDSGAVPTPLEAHALWVAVWIKQGGKVERATWDYSSHDKFTPTKSGAWIPEGYGSGALNLLVLSDVVDQPLHAATSDHRPGWEWGHSEVKTLSHDENGNLVATTNKRRESVYVEKNVYDYLRGKSMPELVERLRNVNMKATKPAAGSELEK